MQVVEIEWIYLLRSLLFSVVFVELVGRVVGHRDEAFEVTLGLAEL